METRFQVRSLDSRLSPEEFRKVPRLPLTVVLDNLRSAFNVGSIFRTADCALVEKVVACGITAHPPNRKLEKTALGTIPFIPWEHRPDAAAAVRELRDAGRRIVALETTDRSGLLWERAIALPAALLVGNEALGVSREALDLADEVIEIPMFGFKNSINVAVAFGVVLHEIQRQHWDFYRGLPRSHERSAE
ncbi:MAG: RNA methyltransferase [bacterium]|nr:RNA methyltransferase [bacterium]